MNGFKLRNQEECNHIINDPAVYLQTSRTGVHYEISGYHTDTCYRFSWAMGFGDYREVFSRVLIDQGEECDLNTEDIRVLVGTGVDAALLAGTLQHFREFQRARLTYVYKDGDRLRLREGSSFEKDEGVLLVHTAGVTYDRVAETINLIFDSTPPGEQPCVQGCMVLFDRSPESSDWRKRFAAFKMVVGIRSPIVPYIADSFLCPYCVAKMPVINALEAA